MADMKLMKEPEGDLLGIPWHMWDVASSQGQIWEHGSMELDLAGPARGCLFHHGSVDQWIGDRVNVTEHRPEKIPGEAP